MGRKTPPWPGYPEWTTARYWSFIRSNVRKMHMKWPPYREARLSGRRLKPADKSGRHKFEHQCSDCKEWFPEKQIQMDHVTPCGSIQCHEDISVFVERLLSPVSGYKKLCINCHQKVTNEERNDKVN